MLAKKTYPETAARNVQNQIFSNAPNAPLRVSFIKKITTSLVLFFGVILLLSPIRNYQFYNFDDDEYITANSFVLNGLNKEDVIWAFTKTHSGHWHPLTWLSHMTDIELFGLDAGKMHFENAFIHGSNSVLLFLLMLSLTSQFGLSLFAAIIFAVHPLRLESVVWISERKDVLSMFFGLLALNTYQLFLHKKLTRYYFLTFVLLTLGLLAKPSLVILPLIFALLDWWISTKMEANFSILKSLLKKTPFLLLSLGSSFAVMLGQRNSGSLHSLDQTPLNERIANVLVSYLSYFGKFFWPTGLSIFYPLQSYPPGIAAGAAIAILTITTVAYKQLQKRPYLIFGWLWFLIALLPVSGIIQVGGQAFADRWTYLPHVGLIFATTLFVDEYFKSRTNLKFICSTIVVASAIIVTRSQLPNWFDSNSIFTHALDVTPNNFMAHNNLGAALDKQGKLDEAAHHYEEAARLNPTYPPALNNLGILRARQNRIEEAIDLLAKSVQIKPSDPNARYNLAIAYSQRGQNLESANELLEVIFAMNSNQQARDALTVVLSRLQGTPCSSLRAQTAHSKNRFVILSGKFSDHDLNERTEIIRKCLDE